MSNAVNLEHGESRIEVEARNWHGGLLMTAPVALSRQSAFGLLLEFVSMVALAVLTSVIDAAFAAAEARSEEF
jgi:hypothetical protein